MPKKTKFSFEDDLERLRAIVGSLEDGPPTLDETLALFEEGMAVAGRLEKTLAAAETKVLILLQDADGSPRLEEDE